MGKKIYVMQTGAANEGGSVEAVARSVEGIKKTSAWRQFIREHVADEDGVYFLKILEWDLDTQEYREAEPLTWWSWKKS